MENVVQQPKYNLGGATGKGFMPGQSGNPNGRPKGSVGFKEMLSRMLKENSEEEAMELCRAFIQHAKNGNVGYANLIVERTDGKVVQPTNITVNGIGVEEMPPEALPQVATELGITQSEIDAIGDGLAVSMLGTGSDDDDA
jgi:hypothetical protein